MAIDTASNMPPVPPAFPAPQPEGPSQSQMAGMATSTPGQSQISGSVMKLAMEIDQALKLLAQAVPTMAGFVEQTVAALHAQIAQSLQSGAVSASPAPPQQEQPMFPGGQGRL